MRPLRAVLPVAVAAALAVACGPQTSPSGDTADGAGTTSSSSSSPGSPGTSSSPSGGGSGGEDRPTPSPTHPTKKPGKDPAPEPTESSASDGLVAFTEVGTVSPPKVEDVTEVTAPDTLTRYLKKLPGKAADGIRAQLDTHGDPPRTGQRMFAFTLSGCQLTGAKLRTVNGELTALPIGGENVRCFRAEHYIAVFTVPKSDVP